MSVSSASYKVQYTLTAADQALAIPFYFLDNSHVRVVRTRDLVDTILTSGFTLTGAGVEAGGTCTLSGAQTEVGDRITIKRRLSLTQAVAYAENDRFPASTHEAALDRLTMMMQQVQEIADRSLAYQEGEVVAAANLLPNADDRADKRLGFDANGAVSMENPVAVTVSTSNTPSFSSFSAARAMSGVGLVTGAAVSITGYSSTGDGGGGTPWSFTSINPGADDNGTILALTDGLGWLIRNYSGPVNVKWFGAKGDGTTDDSTAFQAAVDASLGRVYMPEGTYKLATTVTFDTSSDGNVDGLWLKGEGRYKTVLDNHTGGAALSITSGAGVEFQYNGLLQDFGISNTGGVAGTKGILMSGAFQGSIFAVRINGQASHGLHFYSSIGDLTDCSQVQVVLCEFSDNGGWGVFASADVNAINSNIWLDQNRILTNTAGGVSFESVIQGVVKNNAFAYNGGVGIYAGLDAGPYSKLLSIINNEFDSNTGIQVLLEQVIGVTISGNNFICNTGVGVPVPTKGVEVQATCNNVIMEQNSVRMSPGFTPFTMYSILSGASYVRIINPDWSGWEAAGNTKYADAGTATTIIDEGAFQTLVTVNKGVKFPAVVVPSVDANTLDDYEEGSWVPVVSANTNFNANPTPTLCTYIKIGRMVLIQGFFDGVVTATAVANLTFSLPFDVAIPGAANAICGSVLERNSVTIGSIDDPTGASDGTARIWFPSLAAGARSIVFSMCYISA